MIINLRGTNGSGKSTVVRSFLEKYPYREIFGARGPRYPEAYAVNLNRVDGKHLYILGPYQTPTGGVDALGLPLIAIIEMLEKYRALGHVLFEGVIISTLFGAIGAWMEGHKDEVVVAYLDTELDVCLASLAERGANKGTAHVAEKHKSIGRTMLAMSEAGIRTELLSRENAFKVINGWVA